MIQAVCWTLVHSLWQGLLFALATGLVLLLARRASAAVRYNILCGLFFLFLAVCVGTFVYEWKLAEQHVTNGLVFFMTGAGGWSVIWIEALGRYCSDHALPIVWVWLFVFTVKSLHMFGSLLYTQRIRHYGISAAPVHWQRRVDELSKQLGIGRAVKLVESRIVKMPLVTGCWRPMIFIPLGLLTGLPEGEIEAVLLHELAHIRRNDYLINLLQNAAGNLLFFNPGFLRMSALLREEREHCCDDMAIARTRDKAEFIRALISFKEYDLRLAGLANAFPARRNQLLQRVMRIVDGTNKTLNLTEKIFLACSFVLIFLLLVATGSTSPAASAAIVRMPKGENRVVIDGPSVGERSMPAIKVVKPVKKVLAEHHQEGVVNEADEPALAMEAAVDESVRPEQERAQAESDRQQAMRDDAQRIMDKQQMEKDVEQMIHDRKQAVVDKAQAERDARQAIVDKVQADRDAVQAMKDVRRAEKKPISP